MKEGGRLKPKDLARIGKLGYNLELAEPYVEDDGTMGVAMIFNQVHVNMFPLEEWRQIDPQLGDYLEERFSPKRLFWDLPEKPELDYDDTSLHTDIIRNTNQYVEFSNDLLPSVFATWVISSYLGPLLERSPLLLTYGPPSSGKGQVLDQVRALAYRGFKNTRPTPAILFRLSEQSRLTFALDELQDLDRESWSAIMNVVKCAYDGTPISRCSFEDGTPEVFRTRSFIALSSKNRLPPDDVMQRAIHVPMRLNTEHKDLVPLSSEEHRSLVTRSMAFRFKLLTDKDLADEIIKKMQVSADPEALGFDGRPKDIARALLPVALIYKAEDDLVELIRQNANRSAEETRDTFEAKVQYALDEIWDAHKSKVYTSFVRDHLAETMSLQGDLRDRKDLTTRRVNKALVVLNYELGRGSQNNPYVDKLNKANIRAFESNRRRFPRAEKNE